VPAQPIELTSDIEERLSRAVDGHVLAEARTIREYERILRTTSDPEVRFLINLVLEDEQRHHALLGRLVRALDQRPFQLEDRETIRLEPEIAEPDDIASRLSCAAVDERMGAQELISLANEGKAIDGGLFSLVLRLIALDCEKHALALGHAGQRVRCLPSPTRSG
jgi:rubrerythrin